MVQKNSLMTKKPNVELRTIQIISDILDDVKTPISIYGIQRIRPMNYSSVQNALLFLEKEKRVQRIETSSAIFWKAKK